jgi:ubiquinone biosynthesis protein
MALTELGTTFIKFGRHPDALFSSFDTRAFASASIGQVHWAKLLNGTEVVVKVQHQGIEVRVRADVEIAVELAKMAETYSPELAQYNPVAMAKEFRDTLLDELDFTREQRNLLRFAEISSDDTGIRFPKPHLERCTNHVLTMDLLSGIKIADRTQLEAAGYDLVGVARRGADMFLKTV